MEEGTKKRIETKQRKNGDRHGLGSHKGTADPNPPRNYNLLKRIPAASATRAMKIADGGSFQIDRRIRKIIKYIHSIHLKSFKIFLNLIFFIIWVELVVYIILS